MKIGIIGAMAEEVKLLTEILTDKEVFTEGGATFYHGYYHQHEIYLVQSGIGKVAASVTATLLVAKYQVEQLWNTGSAGGIGQGLQIGDIVIADKLAYHDVDVTAFGYDYGQMAGGFPLYYETNQHLVQKVQQLPTNLTFHVGLIVSGDQFVASAEQIQRIKTAFPEALANEMESTAIAQVAYQFKTPLLIVRAISDTADSHANVDFDQFIIDAGRKSAEMIQTLLNNL